MAELALGMVSLKGLFNNAGDSYEYIRIGQHYARDFETNQTKLDLSRLQLSRWGAALGLDANPTQACTLRALCVSPHNSTPLYLYMPDRFTEHQSNNGWTVEIWGKFEGNM